MPEVSVALSGKRGSLTSGCQAEDGTRDVVVDLPSLDLVVVGEQHYRQIIFGIMGKVRSKAHGVATMTDDGMTIVDRHAEAVAVISERSIAKLHRRDHLLIAVGRHDTTAAQRPIPEKEIRSCRAHAPDGKRPAHVEQSRVMELPV